MGPEKSDNNPLENHPLFLTELPKDIQDNNDLIALQQLAYEGTPFEVAENFKNQGNECFSMGVKYYKNAVQYYTQALEQNFDDSGLRSTLYSNRAAVNLQLENYGRVIEDCKFAVEIAPTSKAYYRMAKAYFSLTKFEEAILSSEDGLKLEPKNKVLSKLIEDSRKEIEKILQKEEIERKRKEEEIYKKHQLQNAVLNKKICFGEKLFPAMENYKEKAPMYLDDNGLLHFPVLFIYEEHHVVDFIQDFCELDNFGDHLQRMFPGDDFPDWDINKKYIHNVLEVYTIVNHTEPIREYKDRPKNKRKRKVKINHTSTLSKVFTHPEYIIPGIPVFYVLRKETKAKSQFLVGDIELLGKNYY